MQRAEGLVNAGVKIIHGTVNATDSPKLVVVPPGFFACWCPRTEVVGLRKPFLARGNLALQGLKALHECQETATSSAVLDLMALSPKPVRQSATAVAVQS